MGSWVIWCKAVALQPHVLISGHGAVLKLPCTAQQEAIHLFLAIFPCQTQIHAGLKVRLGLK